MEYEEGNHENISAASLISNKETYVANLHYFFDFRVEAYTLLRRTPKFRF